MPHGPLNTTTVFITVVGLLVLLMTKVLVVRQIVMLGTGAADAALLEQMSQSEDDQSAV